MTSRTEQESWIRKTIKLDDSMSDFCKLGAAIQYHETVLHIDEDPTVNAHNIDVKKVIRRELANQYLSSLELAVLRVNHAKLPEHTLNDDLPPNVIFLNRSK